MSATRTGRRAGANRPRRTAGPVRRVIPALGMAALFTLGGVAPVRAAWDPLTWYSLDGGGAIAPGGAGWSLSGTMGQWDAGVLGAGGFELGGGFWQGGLLGVTAVEEQVAPPATTFRFPPPTPNPVRGACRLAFELAVPAVTRLVILDVSGRIVRTLDLGLLAAGSHEATWTGDAAGGHPTASGIYFVRLETGAHQAVRRVLRLR